MVSIQYVVSSTAAFTKNLMHASPAKCCNGSGSGQTGCCGHCCKRSFDEDDFFEQEAIRERQTEAINFAPQEHSSNDVAVQQGPENGASYVGAQPGASKSMDMGRVSVPPGRPSMAGQRPSQ